jgi:glycerate kinase
MRKRILISPNSFKECADSVTVAELITQNLSGLKNAELITKPISDGGDGFLEVCKFYFGGEIRYYTISATHIESKFECPILYCESKKEIYIESAEVLGLKIIPLFYRNPLKLSSKGLGELIMHIENDVRKGEIKVEKVYIGIGGTAIIDMGIGLMTELGLKLLDSDGKELNVIPGNFHLAQRIKYKPIKLSFELIPVVDVSSPLFGVRGGIQIFGRQKGASTEVLLILEKSFNHLLNLFANSGLEVFADNLSGAGGGIAVAIQIFYNAGIVHSSEFIKYQLGIERYSDIVDYLITGEGAYDNQTDLGKGVSVLIDLFMSDVKLIFLVCGKISDISIKNLPKYVYPIELRKYFPNQYDSVINYKEGFKKACLEIIKELNF